jgi:hypothetical protein
MALEDTTHAQDTLDIAALRQMVDHSADLTVEAREMSEKARDYYDSHQLTHDELAVLKKRKQPPLVINRIKRKIDSMVGLEQKGRVDPKALPRNPDDEDAADVATKALVFAEDITRFDMKRSAVAYNLWIEGYGGVEVTVKERNGHLDPEIVRLRWEEIFFDPYSRELDFSDAGFMGVQKWMTVDAALDLARDYDHGMDDDDLRSLLEVPLYGADTYDDRPRGEAKSWGDKKKKRIKLASMYYLHGGQWCFAIFGGGGVIWQGPSRFLDDQGQPENAMVLQACYIDRENRRYGIVRDMMSVQDEINKRRSKALHMLNSRQTMGQSGAVADVTKMKRELALPDGHVEYNQDPQSATPSFQIVQNNDQLSGQFELLQESKSEIDMLGPNASLMGQLEGQHSGRAIMAQQQAGYAELAPAYDNLRDWTIRVYRAMWNRIRQFWTDERWIRVTDESEKLQFVGVNVPMKQPMVDPMTGQPVVGPDGQPMVQPVMGPDGQPVLENKIAEIDIDIIVDMSPEYASLQQEQFAQLVELTKSGAVQLPPDVLIEASQLRNKAKLLEKMNDPQAQQQQMQAMQMQMAQLQATIQKLTAEAENKQADTALKTAEAQQIQREAMAPPEVRGPDMGKMADAETKRQKMIVDARLGAERLQIERAKAEAGIRKTQADTAATMVRTQREARTPIADPNKQKFPSPRG